MSDLTELLRNPSRFTDVDQNMEDAADEIEKLTAERDKLAHELVIEGARKTILEQERDALQSVARLALDALSEYGNPYNWDEDFHGIRRKWQEPKSNTPSAYNGFELAQPAITALKAVL